jgi:hypothetical protein
VVNQTRWRFNLQVFSGDRCPFPASSRIIDALDTSPSMVYSVRRQLVEEGFEAVLSREQRATPAVAPIFDGAKEAKLIALARSQPPKGYARWSERATTGMIPKKPAPAKAREGGGCRLFGIMRKIKKLKRIASVPGSTLSKNALKDGGLP